jgi:alkylation response protein AidB-like acyl-CoA dehydrogenase
MKIDSITEFTDELRELQQATRDFAEAEIAPVAQRLHLAGEQIPDSLLAKMQEMGFFRVLASPEYGGLGLGARAVALVTEELSRAWFSAGALPARNWGLGVLLERFGTPEQKKKWLPGIVSGELQAAHSGTEPEAGSDAANIKTTASLRDGRYVVNGTKQWCTHANRADLISLFCRTGRDAGKHGGISLLLVEKARGEQFVPPTLTGSRIETVGYHGMHSYTLFFDDHEVPEENLLGGIEGVAFKQLMAIYELARLQFAFRCIGLARAAYEAALEHSGNRVQFGQPIRRLASLATWSHGRWTRVAASISRPAWSSFLPRKWRTRSVTTPYRYMAAWVSRSRLPLIVTGAIPVFAPLAKAQARSSAWSSPERS